VVGDLADHARVSVERCFRHGAGRVVGFGWDKDFGVEHGGLSEMEDAEPRGVGDGVSAAGRIELVDQLADMEFRGVDRDAESARDDLVRGAFGEQRQHLALARG
jgi:hypothetical protein